MPSTIADFDFLFGHWRIRHRRLKRRLEACTDWEDFTGSCTAWPLLGGAANIDDNVLDLPSGPYRALSLRSFDPACAQWSIWWLDGRHPTQLDTPVVGGFEAGIGTFFADDILSGRPIRVRFRWTRTDTSTPLWEQAFSGDAGAHWEPNWTMEFERSP